MMKILMVSEDVPQPTMGGLGKHAITLAHALAAAGHQVDFMGSQRFSYDDKAREEMALPGDFFPDLWWRFGGWKERTFGFFNPLRRALLARDFARIIMARAGDYDVIHYHGHVPDVSAFIPVNINFVQTRHDQGSDCLTHVRFRHGDICTETDPLECAKCAVSSPGAIQLALSDIAVRQYRARVRRAFLKHKVVFVSDMLRRNFARTAGTGAWGIVVHNFVSDTALRQLTTGLPNGSSAGECIELFIASKLYAPKGVEPLLNSLYGRLPEGMILRIAGDGPDEVRLRGIFPSKRIEFLGWQDYGETLRRMGRSDIVIVPSICEESCATTVLEAMALGKPVHALNRGGTPELQRYERFPGQLRLHSSIDALVTEVLRGERAPDVDLLPTFSGDVAHRVEELHEVYRMDHREFAVRSAIPLRSRADW